MKKITLFLTTLFISTITNAKLLPLIDQQMEPNPKHVELFNTRNFCVLCTLNDAVLSPDTLYDPTHYNANISASYVYGTIIDRLDLTFAFLYAIKGEYFTIKNSKVQLINITYSDLPYFTFTGNEGELVNFTGSGLNYSNFRGAKIDDAIFTGTALEDTDFSDTELKRALFINTYLKNTNFTSAQLMGSDFTHASLTNVNFTGANLLNAKITEEQLTHAIVCNAILPDGSRGNC